MKPSPQKDSEKARLAAEIYGYDDVTDCLQHYIIDSLCPAICMNEDCDYCEELEHDCCAGYCADCDTHSLMSIMLLKGIV